MEEREYIIKKKWDFIMKDPILSISSIKKKAFDGLLANKGLRSLCWKIFLDYIPNLETSSWQIEINKERQHYEDLKNKFIFDPNKANKGENWNINNPLSLEEESPWKQYFENTKLQKTIRQDVERTFPDIQFFRNENVQNILCNILFIYCKLNQDISYRQGMHEILAPILMIIDNDKIDISNTTIQDDLMKSVLNSKYVEHDSFILFCQVMKGAKPWYEYNESISTAVDSSKEKFIVPIIAKCQRIQNEMLKVIDNDLYIALKKHEIEPQLYGLRWLRLLFSREFTMDEVLILWDGIFAEGNNLELVDWIVLVMLTHIREKIIGQEYSVCLTSLMKYPKLEDNKEIIQFVENARKLKANWVKLLSNNNEQHKEIQVNPNNHVKKNKFQSIMKSTDKRISWSGHDPLKFSKGSNKIYTLPSANNINEESKDHIYPKTSLHEKQLEEENNQLKLKVEDLELIIKNANNQINKCMKLMNEIKSNHLNDDEKVIDEHFNHDYNQLMLDMDILKRILGHKSQNHSLKKTLTPISTKANSKATEKHNIIEESSSMPNSLNSETPSTISISNSSTKPYYEKNIKHKDTINNSLPDSIQNKKSETSIHVSVNVKNSDLAKQSLNKFEEDKITSSQHKKEDDKDNNKNSLNPSSSSSLSNLSLSPITTSVVTATAISTMSSPKKDIINNKSNEFLMDSYKDNNNNIWNDSLKTQEYDSFEIKLDQSHRFDDIKLQDSNFGFQSLNSDNELQSTSKNGFNSISLVGNPWEDPWNKNNTAKLSPKISPFSMKIENSNINEQLKNKIISPTSLNFNPFENTINSPNGNNTMTSTNFFNDHNSNIEKNSDTYGKDSSHINSKSPLSSPILNASPVEKPKIETIESPMSASLNKEESSQKKSFIASSYNSSNSLFSTLTSSIKNNDLDKRIQENKKILFSHDDDKDQNKENSHLAFHSNIHQNKFNNTNTSHGLFNDDQDSEDIFEFIKHSKTKNTSQTTISFPNSYYKASDSNPSSNNTTPLTSPKPIHSNIKTNLSFKSSTFISNHRKSSTSSHFDYKAKKSSNMEYVEYDPLLSPNLKTEEPYRSNKDSFESIPIPTTNNEENFTNPIAPFITPTLGLSTTTTITNVSTNSSQKTRASTSTFYRITEEKHKSKKNDDLGVPVVIENIQSTTIDSLDTNKNAKPVLLDPLGAGVVHSLEF